jgi:hypothetical protein
LLVLPILWDAGQEVCSLMGRVGMGRNLSEGCVDVDRCVCACVLHTHIHSVNASEGRRLYSFVVFVRGRLEMWRSHLCGQDAASRDFVVACCMACAVCLHGSRMGVLKACLCVCQCMCLRTCMCWNFVVVFAIVVVSAYICFYVCRSICASCRLACVPVRCGAEILQENLKTAMLFEGAL